MAWLFNGISNHARMADHSAMTFPDADWTLSGRFKIPDNAGSFFQYMLSWGSLTGFPRFLLFVVEESFAGIGDRLRAIILDDSDNQIILDSTDGSPGQYREWQHVGLRRRGFDLEMFWQGQVVSISSPIVIGAINATTQMYIGGRSDLDADRFFGGMLEDFAKWDRALSDDELLGLSHGVSPLNFGVGMAWHIPMDGYREAINGIAITNSGSTVAAGQTFRRYRQRYVRKPLAPFTHEHRFLMSVGEVMSSNAITKAPGELMSVAMDLSPIIGEGDEVERVAAIKTDGGVLVSDITISGNDIQWRLRGGTADVAARCEVHIDTIGGDRLVADGIIEVKE